MEKDKSPITLALENGRMGIFYRMMDRIGMETGGGERDREAVLQRDSVSECMIEIYTS